MTGDELVLRTTRSDQEGLQDSVNADALRQLGQRLGVEFLSRLVRIGFDQLDVDLVGIVGGGGPERHSIGRRIAFCGRRLGG